MGVNFLDMGTSGGLVGARSGASLMIGGDEKIFRKKVKINKNKINIPNFHDLNFIEKITSSAMKFLIKTSPEKNKKWYLAKLSLKSFSCNEKYNNLFLMSEKKINSINLSIKCFTMT